ncbi:hypothetical protein DFH08DRAFT_972625 [Mycena albidolilacea]|uniref:Uncharacterized protein n=1 Tax=Mycena albidolilacea TaxID=1033008 RepID=A0AAD6ZB28_9AGAR|nr:hypothetical protein DFH08DRAFT_972625 [Mycena albidolilacea]
MSFNSANYARARARRRRVVFEQQWLELELVIAEEPDRHQERHQLRERSALTDSGLDEGPGFATHIQGRGDTHVFRRGRLFLQGVPQSDGFDTSSQQQAPPPPSPPPPTIKTSTKPKSTKTPVPPLPPPPPATKTSTKPKSTKTRAPPPPPPPSPPQTTSATDEQAYHDSIRAACPAADHLFHQDAGAGPAPSPGPPSPAPSWPSFPCSVLAPAPCTPANPSPPRPRCPRHPSLHIRARPDSSSTSTPTPTPRSGNADAGANVLTPTSAIDSPCLAALPRFAGWGRDAG